MRKLSKLLLATASFVLPAMSQGHAATYVPVALPSGAISAIAFGINDSNIVAGDYTDSAGVQHGFFGKPNGSNYKTFDYTGNGVLGTQPRAIANDGSIAGFALASGFSIGEEFFRTAGGRIKTFMFNGAPMDGVAQGMNDSDVNMGDYFDANGVRVGYSGKNGVYKRDFKLHIRGWLQNSPRQLTTDGSIVAGYFIDKNGGEHGFIQQGKVAQVVDYTGDPNAILTVLEGVTGDGSLVSGQWDDSSGNPHSFQLNTTSGNFKVLDPGDGSTFQQAWGLNTKGLEMISTSLGLSYIYCPLKAAKCPAGGAAAIVRPDHTIHVAAGTFLKYDAYGRTAHKLPDRRTLKTHGEIQ